MRKCPACGADGARAAWVTHGLRWARCGRCSSLFVEDPPGPAVISSLYVGRRYFQRPTRGGPGGPEAGPTALGYRDYLADREAIERKFDRILERLERETEPGLLLDVGAGPGLMLAVAERRGWSARGVEPNPWAVRHARERVGVDVRAGSLPSTRLGPERFDAVTMLDALEHLERPSEAVAEVASATRPGGVLAIVTPNARSVVGRALGPRWPEALKAPGHLTLFSPSGLRVLLERHGYEVFDRHAVGKTSRVSTLLQDAEPAAPGAAAVVSALAERLSLGERVVTVDPRTKLCVYARLRRP